MQIYLKNTKSYYSISGYEGPEEVVINLEKYKVDTITKIVQNLDMNSDTKIEEINKVLLETTQS